MESVTAAADTGPGLREVVHDAVTAFRWRYDSEAPRLRTLYEKSKRLHWNGATDLDWGTPVDPEGEILPDAQIPIYGTPVWERIDDAKRLEVRRAFLRWTLSQFLHGEQGALVCTAQIAATVPTTDAKFYAAQQVADEARHVEVYARYLDEKLGGAWPISVHLWSLLEDTVRDPRFDMTQLGMQVMIEGLALAAFGTMHMMASEPLLKRLIRRVMDDESRHVAFGVLALRDVYADMSPADLREREEFVVESAVHLRNRFLGEEVWEALEMPVAECVAHADASPTMAHYRQLLFSRIVPNLKRIGLLTPYVRERLEPLGVLRWEDFRHGDEEPEPSEEERAAAASAYAAL